MNTQLNPQTCPTCGSAMESGYLYGGNLFGSFQWAAKEPTLWDAANPSGEGIGDGSHLTFTSLKGFRCSKCRALLINY